MGQLRGCLWTASAQSLGGSLLTLSVKGFDVVCVQLGAALLPAWFTPLMLSPAVSTSGKPHQPCVPLACPLRLLDMWFGCAVAVNGP